MLGNSFKERQHGITSRSQPTIKRGYRRATWQITLTITSQPLGPTSPLETPHTPPDVSTTSHAITRPTVSIVASTSSNLPPPSSPSLETTRETIPASPTLAVSTLPPTTFTGSSSLSSQPGTTSLDTAIFSHSSIQSTTWSTTENPTSPSIPVPSTPFLQRKGVLAGVLVSVGLIFAALIAVVIIMMKRLRRIRAETEISAKPFTYVNVSRNHESTTCRPGDVKATPDRGLLFMSPDVAHNRGSVHKERGESSTGTNPDSIRRRDSRVSLRGSSRHTSTTLGDLVLRSQLTTESLSHQSGEHGSSPLGSSRTQNSRHGYAQATYPVSMYPASTLPGYPGTIRGTTPPPNY